LKITKIITSSNLDVSKTIVERLSMQQIEKNDIFTIYEVFRTSEDNEQEQVILCLHWADHKSISSSMTHIFETYQVFKLIHVWLVWVSQNIDINSWDVILPNTFMKNDLGNPIFLDFAVGENYDFKNFGLILSGICMTGEASENQDSEDYGADIHDNSSFYILEEMQKNEALDKAVVIKGVFDESDDVKKETVVDNSLAILDFIL